MSTVLSRRTRSDRTFDVVVILIVETEIVWQLSSNARLLDERVDGCGVRRYHLFHLQNAALRRYLTYENARFKVRIYVF